MVAEETKGHRERLRQRFLNGEPNALSELGLLELLLTYAVPQKDVRPLAELLLRKFGCLQGVLSADTRTLCEVDGLKLSSAALLKLVDSICKRNATTAAGATGADRVQTTQSQQIELLPVRASGTPGASKPATKDSEHGKRRARTGLFGKAMLKEAIALMPRLPATESLDEVRTFLNRNLHFNAEQTRQRNASYIVGRMFRQGIADRAIREFAVKYAGRQELRDVCFYRFCKAEPLMLDAVLDLLVPSLGSGQLSRKRLQDFLTARFGGMKSIKDCSQAIVEGLAGAGVATADRKTLRFGYREILLPSFAFILHSEFPKPGMYDIGKIENNRSIQALLWNPTKMLSALYELRNQGVISKISEIDTVRQFSTRWTLDQVVQNLCVAVKGR